MRPFRFRAQAALDLRQREHDEALRHRARAQAALDAADAAIAEAEAVIVAAERELASVMGGALEHSRIEWHRSWRSRCVQERTLLLTRRTQQDQELQQAAQQVSDTHRRLRSLERLREHAVVAWNRTGQQEERKTMDALAASRFVQERDDL
jgi:flagellar biosynthesis chaperone FliJ